LGEGVITNGQKKQKKERQEDIVLRVVLGCPLMSQVALYGTIQRQKDCTKHHQGMFLWSWSVTTGLQSCDFDTALGAVVEISGGETRKWKQN